MVKMDLPYRLNMPQRLILVTFIFWLVVSTPVCCHSQVVCPQACSCSVKVLNVIVDCYGRSLTTIPAVNVPNDTRIFVLTYNEITAIEDEAFLMLSSLAVLRLQHNALSRLSPRAFVGLSRLRELILINNRLTQISSIRDLRYLTRLDLGSNFIQEISPNSFQNVADIIDLYLDVSHNFIPSLSSLSPSVSIMKAIAVGLLHFDLHETKHANRLREVNLSENNIRHLPHLGNMTSLEYLILVGNPIHTISEPPSSAIFKRLDVSYAKLTHLPETWSKVDQIQLYLIGNDLESIQDVFHSQTSTVRDFRLSGKKIKDIHAIPYSPNMRSLSVIESRISGTFTLDLCVLPNIVTFDLSKNEISGFRIKDGHESRRCNTSDGTTSLSFSTLILKENRITTMAFLRYLPDLALLVLKNNDIQRIDWEPSDKHKKLVTIDLSYNEIIVLENLTQMSALRLLELSNNKIRVVLPGAFNGSSSITALYLDGNLLTEFPDLSSLHLIRSLDLSFNALKTVTEKDLRNLPFLSVLKLDSNNISNISFPTNLTLIRLFLQNNVLTSLDSIVKTFTLDVSGNRIVNTSSVYLDRLSINKIIIDDNRLGNLHLPLSSEVISCSRNRIKTFSVNFCPTEETPNELSDITCKLIYLYLQWNEISYIEPKSLGDCSIKYLALEGNPIKSFFIEYFPNLLFISLSQTNLQNVSLIAANRTSIDLKVISIVNVTLFHLDHRASLSSFQPPLQKAVRLFLNDNGIVRIPTLRAPFLQNLNLSNNIIKTLSLETFHGIPRVRIIDLSKNSIRTIPGFAFASVVHVIEINLENNLIQSLGQSSFSSQGHFTLRLGNNQLVSLQPSSSLPPLSRNIHLDPNPWRCDCKALALREWLLRSGVQRVYCWSPPQSINRSVVRLHSSELCPHSYFDVGSSGNGIDQNSSLQNNIASNVSTGPIHSFSSLAYFPLIVYYNLFHTN